MAQTKAGAQISAAKWIGIPVEEFRAHVATGMKHCQICREWHPVSEFGKDSSRGDGLENRCKKARSSRRAASYVKRPRVSRAGTRYVPVRDGDPIQARARVNQLVRTGRLPRPNDVPCFDCGHVWKPGERRHEYDHHMGYAAEFQETVQAVCTTCHAARHPENYRRPKAADGTFCVAEGGGASGGSHED